MYARRKVFVYTSLLILSGALLYFVAVLLGRSSRAGSAGSGLVAETVAYARAVLGLDAILPAAAAVQADPKNSEARLRLASACIEVRDSVGAVLALYPLLERRTVREVVPQFIEDCVHVGWLAEAEAVRRRLARTALRPRLLLADAYSRRGERARAHELLQRLEKEPLRADDWLTGALIWLRLREPARATAWARLAAQVRRGAREPAIILARCHIATGRPQEALQVLSRVPRSARSDPQVECWRGLAELRCADATRRLQGWRRLARVAAREPHLPMACFEAGRIALLRGAIAQGISLLEHALTHNYQSLLCYDLLAAGYQRAARRREAAWAQGKAALIRGQLDEAEAAFRASINADPTHPTAYLDLARTFAAAGKLQRALRVLEQAEQVVSQNPQVVLLKARVLGRLERIAEQVRLLETAARLQPERANEPLGELGKVLYESQQFDRARSILEQAVKLEEGDALAHLYLGLTYSRRTEDPANAAKAVKHLLHAARGDPSYFYPWMNAGAVLQRLGYLEEAAACFRRAIAGDPRWEGPYLSLAQILRRQKRFAEQALILRLYRQARQLEARRLRLETAAQQRPQDAAARFALGNQLLRDGRPSEAFPELLLAANLRPEWKEAQARLADVCAILGFDDLRRDAERAAD